MAGVRFDLPPIRVRVTEHQLVARLCGCGATTRAEAPAGVSAPVQYGPRILAVIVYLCMGQYLSKQRTAQALSELFGTPVSAGTVSSATARAADDLDGFRAAVAAEIAAAEVAHFDETGFRAAGKLHWLHSASASLWTPITCHRRRGRGTMNAAGILPIFTGVVVHDARAPYDTYRQITHALCNAHLLRELIAVIDHHRVHADDPESWCWATQVIDSLLAIKTHTDFGRALVDADVLAHHRHLIVHAARIGANESPPDKVGAKHRALARRMGTRIEDYLRFATDPNTPFDNNAAQREIRMVKLR
ncbi:IS66 family transposase [Rhodococcus sp. JS3073]|uniref:IS66 family transposase n=1 Tax=Rhodococcus sp. JS3073 TaxID=3002901 RepID=UPI00228623E8|nr:IS66 family transposase [Rhodococcus sp. JS3073]WAM20042.1 IS66 family transposase [Rhodococcus sp. JS3073]